MKYTGIDVTIEFCLKYGHTIVPKERVPTLNLQIFSLRRELYHLNPCSHIDKKMK